MDALEKDYFMQQLPPVASPDGLNLAIFQLTERFTAHPWHSLRANKVAA
jgi:hypothetical protein